MSDLILHHYELSPFSEKIRLAFGLKNLAWKSVDVPVEMPKPDLTPLTGGYRRAPVLQIGADIFCDSSLILREIERRHPQPSLYPNGTEGLAYAVSWWTEKTTWMPAIVLLTSLIDLPSKHVEDRKIVFGRDLGKEVSLEEQPLNRQRVNAHMTWLALMLKDGRQFLLGDAPSAADLAAYHSIWFVRKLGGAPVEAMLPLKPLIAWIDRIAALGHGKPQEMTSHAALDIAKAASPSPLHVALNGDPSGLKAGQKVVVRADDSGRDPINGVLMAADAEEVVIRHDNPRVGEVNLHFPRAGFDVIAG